MTDDQFARCQRQYARLEPVPPADEPTLAETIAERISKMTHEERLNLADQLIDQLAMDDIRDFDTLLDGPETEQRTLQDPDLFDQLAPESK
jgi:hypothetical protein